MRGHNTKNVVLVADDDLFVRKVIRIALQEFAEVVDVTDGADVKDAYLKHMPDIVFLDIHLPNVSGMELIHTLTKADLSAYIIMISADSSEQNVIDSKYRGCKGFLAKPFEKSRILAIFNRCPTIKFADK